MAKSILIDRATLNTKDYQFPEKLGKLAKLATNANVIGEETFKDPDTDEEHSVQLINTFDARSRQYVDLPGVRLLEGDLLWEVWAAGVTSRGSEYFKFRLTAPLIAPTRDGRTPLPDDTVVGTGQIFVNQAPDGRAVYDLQMQSAVATAEMQMAEKLLQIGTPLETILQCSTSLTIGDFRTMGTGQGRSNSTINYGK